MATLQAFRALRPMPSKCRAIASVPYDVISAAEARALARGNPLSFLHVVRPEISLPEGTDEHADAVYEQGAANLKRYAASDCSVLDDEPALYVYRLSTATHEQTGLFGLVRVDEYRSGTIKKHENTRPPKVADRTRHILTQEAHAEPVMLAMRDHAPVQRQVAAIVQQEPLYDFVATDGVQHTLWRTTDTARLVEAFAEIPCLYVADGHHRCQAALTAHEVLGLPGSAAFPAVIFPVSHMQILPYNRVVRVRGTVPLPMRATGQPSPRQAGEVCVYVNGSWHGVTLPATKLSGVHNTLDVARLGEFILGPGFGIYDQRTDPRIEFVGGSRGTAALEERASRHGEAVAFSMHATSMDELVRVSDAGLLMPPKSTWFEPKLRSGLLVNLIRAQP